LRTFPKLRKAARTMASAVEVLMSAPEAAEDRLVSLVEVWKAIEEVVPREKLASAVETVAAFVSVTDDDARGRAVAGRAGQALPHRAGLRRAAAGDDPFPRVPEGQIDKAAFVLCAVMHLHRGVRRRARCAWPALGC
jgi:hypothetical protein